MSEHRIAATNYDIWAVISKLFGISDDRLIRRFSLTLDFSNSEIAEVVITEVASVNGEKADVEKRYRLVEEITKDRDGNPMANSLGEPFDPPCTIDVQV